MDESNAAFLLGRAVGGIVGCLAVVTVPTLFVGSLIVALVKKSRAWGVVAGVSGVLLVGLGGVAVVLGIVAARRAANDTSPATAISTAGSSTVASTEGRALLDIPGDWSEMDLENEHASLQVGNPQREEYLIVIAEPATDFDLDLDGFTELASGLTLGAIAGAQTAGPPVALDLNGLPARRLEISGAADGVRVVYHATYVEGAGHYYQVLAWTLPSKRDAAFPRYDQVVATFRER